jgi:alpha-tubulin suppressor-like RCC1 family protein
MALVGIVACKIDDAANKHACTVDSDCDPGRYCETSAGTCVAGVVAAAASGDHTCALRQGGSVQCWGKNTSDDLGSADTTDVFLPLPPGTTLAHALNPALGPTVSIGAGHTFTCALLEGGNIYCWGSNDHGQLGQGPGAASPGLIDLGGGTAGYRAVSLAVGWSHACAALANGSVKCWGDNTYGQLGIGDTRDRGLLDGDMGDNLPTVPLGDGDTARAVAAGASHSCALLEDRSMMCWGRNQYGQLGVESTTNLGDGDHPLGDPARRAMVGQDREVFGIAAGGDHSCALLDGGQLRCWGLNTNGELGIGSTNPIVGDGPGTLGNMLPVVNVGTGRTVRGVVCGIQHMCALLDNRQVKCWGDASVGQLGLDSTVGRGGSPADMGDNLPHVDLGTGRTVLSIASGDGHNCAVLDTHELKCWGYNAQGQLGLSDLHDNRGDGINDTGLTGVMEMGDQLPAVDFGP